LKELKASKPDGNQSAVSDTKYKNQVTKLKEQMK